MADPAFNGIWLGIADGTFDGEFRRVSDAAGDYGREMAAAADAAVLKAVSGSLSSIEPGTVIPVPPTFRESLLRELSDPAFARQVWSLLQNREVVE